MRSEDYPAALRALFRMSNIRGALSTMPHKVTTLSLADRVSTTAKIAGAANEIGRLSGRAAGAVQDEQHPRRADHDAAQGDDAFACRPGQHDRQDRRRRE